MPSFNGFWIRLQNQIQTVNLFVDIEKTTAKDIKNQRISTFIFLITIVLSITALLLYSSLTVVTKVVVIHQPSVSIYKELESNYADTLVCPCTRISNEYNKFIQLPTPTFNQICASDFIHDEWLNYVNYRPFTEAKYHYLFDFRHSAYSFFLMLRTLCTLTSQTIIDQSDLFLSTNLLTENVISEDTFLANTKAAHDHFISTTKNSFQTALNSFRLLVQGNAIINRLETNYRTYTIFLNQLWYATTIGPMYPSNNCYCWTSSLCNTPTGFYTTYHRINTTDISDYTDFFNGVFSNQSRLEYEVPGIHVGCTTLDAILQSDLTCLYNKSCLLQLNNYLNDSLHPFNASALTLLPSISIPTIAELVNELMVDNWTFISSYEKYFNQCSPSICTYTFAQRFDINFILTTTTGFLGGIIAVLMLLTLPAITFIRERTDSCIYSSSSAAAEATVTEEVSDNQTSINIFIKAKYFVLSLNFFEDIDQRTDWHLVNQRLATRVFIVTLTLALLILSIYTILHETTKSVIIQYPTIDDYLNLELKYPQTVTCPCTSISNEYKQFISFEPIFHQICYSDFILKNWTDYLFYYSFLYPYDIRNIGQSFFPTLASFCNLSLQTINSELFVFNATKYVTKIVQRSDLFQMQTQQIISLFKQSTTNSFLQLLSMFRETMAANALYSALLTNYASTVLDDNSTETYRKQVFYSKTYTSQDNVTCTCKTNPITCNQLSGIYNGPSWIPDLTLLFAVPGFHTACSIVDTIFLSTLECYFDQSCIDSIYNLTAANSLAPFNATAMKYNSSQSQYKTTTRIQFIVEQLMIEEWNNKTSFNRYYSECNPTMCIYTYNQRADAIYIFTTLIALIGGLTTVLRIIIPSFIALIRRKKRQVVYEDTLTVRQIIQSYILGFNLFKNRNERSDTHLRHQRLSTRIFIIILCATLVVQIVYITFENVTHTVTSENLSIDKFVSLHEKYPTTLQCPCQTLSIEYQNFIVFQPHLHSICSSDFTNSSSLWWSIDYPRTMFTANGRPLFRTKIDDFRQIASPFFQIITSFCTLSNQKLNTELIKFNSTTFITPNLITRDQFEIQINQIINQFIDNIARSFWGSLLLINNMTHANMLISALSSDSFLTLYPDYYYGAYEYIYDRYDEIYNSTVTEAPCNCQETPRCVQQAVIYALDTVTELQSLLGIFVGCYVVEAALQSDLRCFYDSDCLQQLINNLHLSNVNVSSIILEKDSTRENTRFHPETQLLEIVSNLMIETWNNQTSYENYFNKCQPSMCTASYVSRRNIAFSITVIIGLIGGLTDVYKFIVPLGVRIIFRHTFPFLKQKYVARRNNAVSIQNLP